MQYRKIKKSGIELSAFGIGCMRFPMIDTPDGKKVDIENAKKIIRTAIDNGVNYIDTAYVYSQGTNESVVGQALADGYRKKVYLATKLPSWLCKTPEDLPKFFDEQCRALGTDYIDFYLVHALNRSRWDKMKELGIKEFLDKLKAEGKIKYACFSFHDNFEAYDYIINDYPWDMSQIQYNYYDAVGDQPGERGIRLAGKLGIPVVIMEGLLGGKLAKVPSSVQAVFDSYPEKRSPVEWAFRWLCNDPAVATVLSGVTSPEMALENIEIFNKTGVGTMSEDELEILDRARDEYKKRTAVGCTGCRYCMPCPSGVSIPEIFAAWNNAYRFESGNDAKNMYRHLKDSGNGADKCIGCGQCEGACPQHLSIRDLIQQADKELS